MFDVPSVAIFIARALAAQIGAPAPGDDAARRAFFRKVAEQVVFNEHAEGAVGVKAQSPAHPPCKDCIAWKDGELLFATDLQNGTTGAIALVGTHDVTGQFFIPVEGVNHLGRATVPPEPMPGAPAPDRDDLVDLLLEIAANQSAILVLQRELIDELRAVRTQIEAEGVRLQRDGLRVRLR